MNISYNLTVNLTDIVIGNDDVKSSVPAASHCDEGTSFLRLVAIVWISLPMASIGIMGNILAFIVLCCYRQKLSTTILLQALAVVDSLILLSVILLQSLYVNYACFGTPAGYKEPWKMMFRWMFPLLFALRMMDTWLITLLTYDRWIAVCKPLQAQHLCRLGATYRRIAIVIVCSFVFSFPRYLESSQYGIPITLWNPEWAKENLYAYIYKMSLFFVAMYLVPTAILIVLNIKLLRSLRINDPALNNRRHSKHGKQCGNQSQHRSITVIVLTVVAIYFICNILAIVSQVFYSLELCFEELKVKLENHRRIISIVNNMFMTFNSASNFFIYCICSKNFRNVMYRTFGCRGKLDRFKIFRNYSRTSDSNGEQTVGFDDSLQSKIGLKIPLSLLKPVIKNCSQHPEAV